MHQRRFAGSNLAAIFEARILNATLQLIPIDFAGVSTPLLKPGFLDVMKAEVRDF